MDYTIRRSTDKDMLELARFVAIVWNETYKGLVPKDYLDKMYDNIEERAKHFLEKRDFHEYLLIIDNKISGFIRFGKSESEPDKGEIYALYVLAKYQKRGFGKIFVNLAIKELKKMGFNKMIIACLVGNPTNEFYKHIGGKYYKEGLFKKLNLKENIYLYEDIKELK
ncbi:MAG: GNAT family N-acetyltransferase [Bacilli bacterium]|nr:GNAT family N-acetyltransferase [Bacilli bacterium]